MCYLPICGAIYSRKSVVNVRMTFNICSYVKAMLAAAGVMHMIFQTCDFFAPYMVKTNVEVAGVSSLNSIELTEESS